MKTILNLIMLIFLFSCNNEVSENKTITQNQNLKSKKELKIEDDINSINSLVKNINLYGFSLNSDSLIAIYKNYAINDTVKQAGFIINLKKYTDSLITDYNLRYSQKKEYSQNSTSNINTSNNSDYAKVNSEYPGKWIEETNSEFNEIVKTLIKNNIKGCGEFYFKRHKSSSANYLVACTSDGINWNYYMVYTASQKVLGPYNNTMGKAFNPY